MLALAFGALALTAPEAAAQSKTPADTIVIATGGDYFDGIDPARSGFWVSNEFQIGTHERLIDFEHKTLDDGRVIADPYKIIGGLAESFEVAADQLSITFKLRPGKKFTNGDPVTAQSVKDSYARMLNIPGVGKFALSSMMKVEKPEQMVVVDEHTIRFDLEKPNPIFVPTLSLNNLSVVNPNEVEANKKDDDPYALEWMKVHSTGTGPYVLDKWSPGVELSFKLNPNYVGEEPKIKRIIYKVVPSEQDRLLLIKNGDVDVAYTIDQRHIEDLKNSPGVNVLAFPTYGKEFIFVNPNLEPFKDKRVREAFAHAINRDQILDTVFHGLAEKPRSPLPNGFVFQKDMPERAHDPDKARQLLEEAGHKGGLALDIFYQIGSPIGDQASVWVQADLAKVGVTVRPQMLAPATFTERMRGGELPFGFANFVPYVPHPIYHVYWQYYGGSGFNYSRYDNPEVNQMIETVQSEPDVEEQRKIFDRMQDIVHGEAVEILMAQPFYTMVMRDTIKGYVFYPDRLNRWHLVHKE